MDNFFYSKDFTGTKALEINFVGCETANIVVNRSVNGISSNNLLVKELAEFLNKREQFSYMESIKLTSERFVIGTTNTGQKMILHNNE